MSVYTVIDKDDDILMIDFAKVTYYDFGINEYGESHCAMVVDGCYIEVVDEYAILVNKVFRKWLDNFNFN